MRPSRIILATAMIADAGLASAQITFDSPGSHEGNCIPFGCVAPFFGDITGYQQVFAASAFAGPVLIGGITFYPFPGDPYGATGGGMFELRFSTTSVPVGGLSPELAANVTGTNRLFGVAALIPGGPLGLTVAGIPFVYDPTAGNLLLTMTISRWTPGTGSNLAYTGPTCSRAWNSVYNGATNDRADARCLVTTLSAYPVSAVPEPTTWLLCATGLCAIAGVVARRERRL